MRFLLPFFLCFFFNSTFAVTIIIDLEDFLMKEVRTRTVWDVGPSHFLGFFDPTQIINNYFATLDCVYPQRDESFPVIKDGLLLPQIIKDWLSNRYSADVCKTMIIDALKKYEATTGIKTGVYRAIAEHVFTPVRYAKVRDYEPDGLKILKRLHAQKDLNGNRKHKIYILSNQNAESFAELSKNKHIQEALSFCDGVIISGNAHKLMPEPGLFNYAFSMWNIDDHTLVIYISAEITYVTAVRNLGKKNIYCIHHQSFKSVMAELKQLTVCCN